MSVPFSVADGVVDEPDQPARTATGKPQKSKLPEPYWLGHERQVN